MNDEYLSVSQVAQLKSVSRNSVYKAVNEGRLIAVCIAGVAIRRTDAERWIPKSRTGRRKGSSTGEEAKAKISESQKARWLKRKKDQD